LDWSARWKNAAESQQASRRRVGGGNGGGIFNRSFTHACTLEIDLGRVPLIRRWAAVIRKNQSVCAGEEKRVIAHLDAGSRPSARRSYSRSGTMAGDNVNLIN
jgi:hypothetical protein